MSMQRRDGRGSRWDVSVHRHARRVCDRRPVCSPRPACTACLVFGQPAHAGDRPAHGARRQAGVDSRNGRRARKRAAGDRARRRSGRSSGTRVGNARAPFRKSTCAIRLPTSSWRCRWSLWRSSPPTFLHGAPHTWIRCSPCAPNSDSRQASLEIPTCSRRV